MMLDVAAPRASLSPLPVRAPERADLRLTDGTNLVSSVWRPDTADTLPVLLMRQPYGRAIASTVTLAHPSWYAARGYIVVVQDVRGTGDSEGDFDALANEAEDGAETLAWARSLPGANGKLGTYGFSYQGTTQFLALAAGGKPDAMATSMASWNPLYDWASEGGLFRTATSTRWAGQMARLKAQRRGDAEALTALAPERDWRDLFRFLCERPDLSHLIRWAQGMVDGNPSRSLTPPPPVPLLQTAGAHDFLLRGTLAADAAFRAVSPETTHLIFGPWAHIGWNRSAGAAQLGPGAELSVDRAQISFFDHYLKSIGDVPAACLAYDGGTDSWRAADPGKFHGEPSTEHRLSSGGLAATLLTDGRLGSIPGESEDVLVHDPLRPAPLVGGATGNPQGPVDLAAHDNRADVACYTTAPLAEDTLVAGSAVADLSVSIDGDVSALAGTLCLVTSQGSALALATTVAPVDQGRCRLRFEGLYRTLKSGEALRLSIHAAPSPDYLPYPVLTLPESGVRGATIILRHEASRVFLPMNDQGNTYA
ncbi:CocE/NonD family hydrolase [Oricola sp.]|uniref:CocE/NonD family hydrolase n=1 Tax=Oricola sp. TaxID=1979950 RepID=UPI000C978D14|nr:peptidase S15 [Ahrensia sp.]|tara:strand:- start:185227 stop:186837 length:1611 start_codon:yes stop_codon:yes gene_type:complete